MDCELTCMSCNKPQLYKVNASCYHGLCESHKTDTSKILKCIHCCSIVPILYDANMQPCEKCFNLCDTTCKNCEFYVCSNCMSNGCLICQSLCNYCIISKDAHKLTSCMHTICQNCIQNTACPLCESMKEDVEADCEYCYEKKATTKKCAHYICEDCFANNQSLCPLCTMFKITDNGNSIEKTNLEKNTNLWQTPGCDEENNIEKSPKEADILKRTVYLKESNTEKNDIEAKIEESDKKAEQINTLLESPQKIQTVTKKKNEYFLFIEEADENILETGAVYNSPHHENPIIIGQPHGIDIKKNLNKDRVEFEERQVRIPTDGNRKSLITFGEDFHCNDSKSSIRNNFHIAIEPFEIDEGLKSETTSFRKMFFCCKKKENLLEGNNKHWYISFYRVFSSYNCNLRQVGQKYFRQFISCCDLCKRFKMN